MSIFYTRAGDSGQTGILGKGRVPKSDLRIETVGCVDEACAALGMARAQGCAAEKETLVQIQRHLYGLMGEVSATPENVERFRVINPGHIEWLEAQIDRISSQVVLPKEFITPGDCLAGAAFSMARTIVRRAERRLVELSARGDAQNPDLLRYLNRLSSYCFVMELFENHLAGNGRQTLMSQERP